jgi:hypothetical protein
LSSKNCIVSPSFSIWLKMSFPKLLATYFLRTDKCLSLTDFKDGQIRRKARYPLCHYGIGGYISFSWFSTKQVENYCQRRNTKILGGKMRKGKIRKVHYEILRHQEKACWKPSSNFEFGS